MSVELRLRGGSGSTTWPADSVVLRFDDVMLREVDLTRAGQSVYPGGPLSAGDIDSVQSGLADFEVTVLDPSGGIAASFRAREVEMRRPVGYEAIISSRDTVHAVRLCSGSISLSKIVSL